MNYDTHTHIRNGFIYLEGGSETVIFYQLFSSFSSAIDSLSICYLTHKCVFSYFFLSISHIRF